MNQIKILFVDDNQDLVKILQMALQVEPDLQSVGSLATADELLFHIKNANPDVVLLDLRMPGKDSIEAVKEVIAIYPHIKLLLFTGYEDPLIIERALAAGAVGVISKELGLEEIFTEIRKLASSTQVMNA